MIKINTDNTIELNFNTLLNISQIKRFFSITLNEKLNVARKPEHILLISDYTDD